jgi:hypothetical protein
MSSSQVLSEAMKKINYNNLHETIFTYDPNEDESVTEEGKRRALDANKVGHLAPDAPKVPNLALTMQRVFNKNALREAKKRLVSEAKGEKYTYADSQRRPISRKRAKLLKKYESAVDERVVVFNQMTARVTEAVAATAVERPRPPKNDLLAKIAEITRRISIMQAKAIEDELIKAPVKDSDDEENDKLEGEVKPPVFDLSVAIHELTEASIVYAPDENRVECRIVMPLHVLDSESERQARRILNRAVEDFKAAVVDIVLNPDGEHVARKVEVRDGSVKRPAVDGQTGDAVKSSSKV